MKPPICEICDERFDPADGRLLVFVGDERSIAWREAADADRRVGHPPDTGWFCSEHMLGAAAMAPTSTLGETLTALRKGRGAVPESRAPAVSPGGGESASTTERDGAPTTPSGAGCSRASLLPDDYRQVEIAPMSVDTLAERLGHFFDDLVDACAAAAGVNPNREADDLRRTVEQLASPEWREKGPASEEVETTRVVALDRWECQFSRLRHDWIGGGSIQSSVSVAVIDLDAVAPGVVLRVGGGAHAGSPVTTVSGFGRQLGPAAPILDALLAELAA